MRLFERRLLPLRLCLLLAWAQLLGPFLQSASAAAPGWVETGTHWLPRPSAAATLLPDGKVFVTGGLLTSSSPTAELYNPATGTWSLTSAMTHKRCFPTVTLLPDGKVLVAGGTTCVLSPISVIPIAELYDPAAGTWASTKAMVQGRYSHTATLLPDGKVLVAGGSSDRGLQATAELYDPATGTWSATGRMTKVRGRHTATLLPNGKVLVVSGTNAEEYDPVTGTWTSTGDLAQSRYLHTATLLPDGRVLVVGGSDARTTAELYDPVSRGWTPTEALPNGHYNHTATLLLNGTVLVAGGAPAFDVAEIYDPATGLWTSTPPMAQSRLAHTATLLPNGQVLVAGGSAGGSTSELYTPAAGTWDSRGALAQGRSEHTATLLPSGKVLVAAGTLSSATTLTEVYDPATDRWTATGRLAHRRYRHTATLLRDGQVLVAGGSGSDPTSCEVYDPLSETWAPTGAMTRGRSGHTATRLPNGKVLVVGGSSDPSRTTAEIYDPQSRTWSPTGAMTQGRFLHSATLLLNGKVLVVGGSPGLNTAEEYDPATGTWSSTGALARSRFGHTATLLPSGKVLVVGGASRLTAAELYDPDTRTWSSTGALAQGRSDHTATLLPSGEVLVVGGFRGGTTDRFIFSAETYNPATGLWSAAGSLKEARYKHTATLLLGGEVLVVGGQSGASSTPSSAEAYRQESPAAGANAPTLSAVSPTSLEPGTLITVTGERLRHGDDGTMRQLAPIDYPLLSLRSIESGHWVFLRGSDSSNSALTAALPALPIGHYLLTLTRGGKTSSRALYLDNITPPGTALGSGLAPARVTRATTATFAFSSSEVDTVAFECRLNQQAFVPCSSPTSYASLPDGDHSFQVRARDMADNVDLSPAEYAWSVDTKDPETAIELASKPRDPTRQTSAILVFSSEAGASFECSLGEADFTACTSPYRAAGLWDGLHTFWVRAIDVAGNVDSTPATHSWQVDTMPPDSPVSHVPAVGQEFITAQPVFSGLAEPDGTVSFFIDGVAAGETRANSMGEWEFTPPAPLGWGFHTAWATTTDPAGNTSAPSLEMSFTTSPRGYYELGCSAASSPWRAGWLWALLMLALPCLGWRSVLSRDLEASVSGLLLWLLFGARRGNELEGHREVVEAVGGTGAHGPVDGLEGAAIKVDLGRARHRTARIPRDGDVVVVQVLLGERHRVIGFDDPITGGIVDVVVGEAADRDGHRCHGGLHSFGAGKLAPEKVAGNVPVPHR